MHVDRTLPALGASTSAVRALSALGSEAPDLHYAVRRRVKCTDVLCLLALDSELHGVLLLTPTRKRISLSAKAEKRWRTVASHIGAADRLRRALGCSNQERLIPITSLPRALKFDTRTDTPAPPPPSPSLRDAAVRIDSEERGCSGAEGIRTHDVLRDLSGGELSLLDSFDRNGRRFILARPHDPSLGDPRSLTPNEQQVVLRTARGQSRKLAGYHLGISRSSVSRLLGSAMRKLGVKTQAELVMKVRCLESHGLVGEN
jgi:DNA-binding CsgD family transcriptional regulator